MNQEVKRSRGELEYWRILCNLISFTFLRGQFSFLALNQARGLDIRRVTRKIVENNFGRAKIACFIRISGLDGAKPIDLTGAGGNRWRQKG